MGSSPGKHWPDVVFMPRKPGRLVKSCGMILGKCVHVCMLLHVCRYKPGKGLMGEPVCDRHGDKGAFPTE